MLKRKFPGRATIREHIKKQITPANKAIPLVAYPTEEEIVPSGFDSATSFAAFKEAALAMDSKSKLSPKISKQKIKQFKVLKHTYRGAYEIREASWERTSNEKSLERSPVSVKHLPF